MRVNSEMVFNMIEKKHYTKDFYGEQQSGSLMSAHEIIKLIEQVIKPKSVIDIGCGVGYWLKIWNEEFGLHDILGIEGPYITPSMLKISEDKVLFKDLKQPINLNRKFDLVMSLEVAEHLPENNADKFIDSLVQLGDVILFSAAIIGQEGTYHINEQMPEYWAEKFMSHNYVPVDYIRPKIWYNEKVEWWYRQNVILYIKEDVIDKFPDLKEAYASTNPQQLLRIQPWLYMYKHKHKEFTKNWIGYIRWKLYPVKKFFLGKKFKN